MGNHPLVFVLLVSAAFVQPATATAAERDVIKTICKEGCDFTDLVAARDWINGAEPTNIVTLTIQIGDGDHVVSDQISADSPKWARVRIRGNCVDPSRVVLLFENKGNNAPAFSAVRGGNLGLIDCLTIKGVGGRMSRSAWAPDSYGAAFLAVGSGASIHAGSRVTVEGSYYGLLADEGGRFTGDAGFTVNNSGDASILTRFNGVVNCQRCRANTASHIATDTNFGGKQTLGWNFLAEEGGELNVDGSTGTDAQIGGFGAITNGKVWARHVTVSGSQGSGARADSGGVLDFYGSSSSGNNVGVSASLGGKLV